MWRRKAGRRPALPEREFLGVPLTPGEAQLLVTALEEDDRLERIYFWAHDGSAYSRSQAAKVRARAGMAAALGQQVVPVPISELHMYEYALSSLRKYAPQGEITRDFGALLGKMHALSGVARVHRWRVRLDESVWTWVGAPPLATWPDEADLRDGTRAVPRGRGRQ